MIHSANVKHWLRSTVIMYLPDNFMTGTNKISLTLFPLIIPSKVNVIQTRFHINPELFLIFFI